MTDLRPLDPELEFLDRAALDALQLAKLKALLRHVAATNPFYAARWEQAGLDVTRIQSFADFRRAVPMLTKADFLEDQRAHPPFGRRIGALGHTAHRIEIYTTSGTSGQGVEVHVQTKRELEVMERLYAYYFRWAGLGAGDSTALTLPITMLAGGRAEYQGAVAYDLSVLPIGNYSAAQKAELIRRFRPKALFGSSSYFAHLGSLLEAEGTIPQVDVLLTGLEGVGLSFFKKLEMQWGARVAERFGCAQMRTDFMFTDESGIGSPASPGTLYNMDPYVYLELLDPSTGLSVRDGEFGEMVVTSLFHLDNPVIRIRLNDGAVFRSGERSRGPRKFQGVELASITRLDDVKKVKGINIYPQAVDDLVHTLPEIAQYEVVLSSTADYLDVATLNVQLKSRESTEKLGVESTLRSLCKERLGIHFEVCIVPEIAVSDYKARRWKDLRERR